MNKIIEEGSKFYKVLGGTLYRVKVVKVFEKNSETWVLLKPINNATREAFISSLYTKEMEKVNSEYKAGHFSLPINQLLQDWKEFK
ncbi:MAG: hypothetical protein ACOC2U_00305 [bacterium]